LRISLNLCVVVDSTTLWFCLDRSFPDPPQPILLIVGQNADHYKRVEAGDRGHYHDPPPIILLGPVLGTMVARAANRIVVDNPAAPNVALPLDQDEHSITGVSEEGHSSGTTTSPLSDLDLSDVMVCRAEPASMSTSAIWAHLSLILGQLPDSLIDIWHMTTKSSHLNGIEALKWYSQESQATHAFASFPGSALFVESLVVSHVDNVPVAVTVAPPSIEPGVCDPSIPSIPSNPSIHPPSGTATSNHAQESHGRLDQSSANSATGEVEVAMGVPTSALTDSISMEVIVVSGENVGQANGASAACLEASPIGIVPLESSSARDSVGIPSATVPVVSSFHASLATPLRPGMTVESFTSECMHTFFSSSHSTSIVLFLCLFLSFVCRVVSGPSGH
jgi:hypothetical protein